MLDLGSLPVSLRRLDSHLAGYYSSFARSQLGRWIGHIIPGAIWSLCTITQAKRTLTLLEAAPIEATTQTLLLGWSNVLYHGLTLLFLALFTIFTLIRRPAHYHSGTFSSSLIAVAGTAMPILLVLDRQSSIQTLVTPVASGLLLVGIAIGVLAIASLGRCFSILPEVRGLVMHGPYRWVRHPLYLAELVVFLGVLLPIITPYNLVIYLLFCGLQMWRAKFEEAGLETIYPEYGAYKQRTARLLPGIF